MGARLVAGWLMVALMLVGPLQPLAAAQQPGPTETPGQPPTPAPPELPPAQPPAPPDVQAQPPAPEPPAPPAAMQPPPPPPPLAPPPPPPPPVVQPPPPPQPPVRVADQQPPLRKRQGADVYDVIAVIMTIVGAPPKAVVCGLGVVLGSALYALTLASADRASVAIMREGCGQNWHVKGRDIRPEPSPSQALEWDQR